MQAMEEEAGPTAAPEGSNRDGASAVGDDSRATAPDAPATAEPAFDEVDPLFEEARRVVIQNQKAGVRYLKSALKVGYIRAHALLEQLEKAGVIGPREFGEQAVLVAADGAAAQEGGAA
jgi:S-DNA-T family DNA segregation ATPase FtsK/SpoIIIE